jgi:hypothetical protein
MTITTDAKFEYVSPDNLYFDPQNPRFGGDMKQKSQEEIQSYLYGRPHFAAELVDSFLENGFIDYEPLVARKEKGKYIIIEGNRRLAAIKHILSNRDTYRHGRLEDLERLPLLSFPERPNEQQQREMRVYLGVRHLFGFREWPPLSKAKFLDQEIQEKGDISKVVRELGLSKQEIRRLLIPYRALQKAKENVPEQEDYWKLGEALSRTGIKAYVELDIDRENLGIKNVGKPRLRHLLNFIYGRMEKKSRNPETAVVTDTRQLSKLARVLENEKAAAALEKGSSLEDAALFVESRAEGITRLEKLTKQLRTLLKEVFKLRANSHGARELLARFSEFEAAVKTFLKHADPNI